MIPGVISGEYLLKETEIDLRSLANRAGVALVIAEIKGLDLNRKKIFLYNRPPIIFSTLSLDVGSETRNTAGNPKLTSIDSYVPIKPFDKAIKWIEKQDDQSNLSRSKPFSVVGSGLAAFEIIFALRRRWPDRPLILQVYSGKLEKNIRKVLLRYKIELVESMDLVRCPGLLCTGSLCSPWLQKSGLSVDHSGRALTSSTFQSIDYSYIFVTGDCGVFKNNYRPPSGVWAVRSAKPLARNLERFSRGLKLLRWKPQKHALQLIGGPFSSEQSYGWAFWSNCLVGPSPLLWRLKKVIDKRFMDMLSPQVLMKDEQHQIKASFACRGCAAKLSSEPLKHALYESDLADLGDNPKDAALIFSLPSSQGVVQTVDGFPALISDPWLNARLTTLHACSDIWATGASVISAQPLINLPAVSIGMQKELLSQSLRGIKSVLELQDAKIIGGHTMEDRSEPTAPITLGIDISLSINGIVSDDMNMWLKDGMQIGDVILLSRQLGSGVLFAAAMRNAVNPCYIDQVIEILNISQHNLVEDLVKMKNYKSDSKIVHACTDITGFGLLGHLNEMLRSSNSNRLNRGMSPIKIKLEAKKIPAFSGVINLFRDGYSSTLAPANRAFWNLLHPVGNAPFELILGDIQKNSDHHKQIMELIVDPQTCGPLALSCSKEVGAELVNDGPWIQVGSVEPV
tara:strand:+ start:65717 stop:67762 length:2046 start_codon:yes stop_codon:yes gene_type:complete